mmetsp:Transcript_12190/g.15800  ORF Transcript_12190/g.15800 Transcript_12190/m.15800 type:complete len:406 (-) Transcript_12190:313-1530(-)
MNPEMNLSNESTRLLPKYHMKSERKAFIRNRQKSLIVQLYLRMLLTFLASCICSTILACLEFGVVSDMPMYVVFLPLWIGHVVAIGIYVYLSQTLYAFCRVPIPQSSKRANKVRASFIVEEDMIPIVHRFLTVGSWLMLGTLLLVCTEVLLYCKLAGSGISYFTVTIPILLGTSVYFLQGVMCKGQNWIATTAWFLLLIGFIMVDLGLDGVLGTVTDNELVVFAPFWLLLLLLTYTFARLLVFHGMGIIYLTTAQTLATYGYLAGFVVTGLVSVWARCNYGDHCNQKDTITIWVLILVAELLFFYSVYRVTQQQVQLSLARTASETTPLPLTRMNTGEWDVDRTQGQFSVVFIGTVRFDMSRAELKNNNRFTKALWIIFCCEKGLKSLGNPATDDPERTERRLPM